MYPTQYWELRASDKNVHKLNRVITLYDYQSVLIDYPVLPYICAFCLSFFFLLLHLYANNN